jgi:enterochelin esterase-like enzyme
MKGLRKGLLPFLLSSALVACCGPDGATRDARTSVVRELQSGTVYKIETKTNGLYYPHLLYLPHTENERIRLPVVYFCGAGAPDWIFFNLGVATYLDDRITQGKVRPFAVVAASCLDYYTDFELTLLQSLIPYLEANFPLTTDRRGRGICGISAGGSLALYMAFTHRDLFGVLGLHSATLVGDDQERVQTLLETGDKTRRPRLFMDVGRDDILYEAYMNLHKKLASAASPYEFSTPDGGHTRAYWQRQLPAYIAWYASVLEPSAQ